MDLHGIYTLPPFRDPCILTFWYCLGVSWFLRNVWICVMSFLTGADRSGSDSGSGPAQFLFTWSKKKSTMATASHCINVRGLTMVWDHLGGIYYHLVFIAVLHSQQANRCLISLTNPLKQYTSIGQAFEHV